MIPFEIYITGEKDILKELDSWGKVYYNPWENNNKGIAFEYEDVLEFALLEGLKLIK